MQVTQAAKKKAVNNMNMKRREMKNNKSTKPVKRNSLKGDKFFNSKTRM
jgi:hypothetical protein